MSHPSKRMVNHPFKLYHIDLMILTVNNRTTELDLGDTVVQLLELLDFTDAACAVEVNTVLVPKCEHGNHHLNDGDIVEIVTLVGGG